MRAKFSWTIVCVIAGALHGCSSSEGGLPNGAASSAGGGGKSGAAGAPGGRGGDGLPPEAGRPLGGDDGLGDANDGAARSDAEDVRLEASPDESIDGNDIGPETSVGSLDASGDNDRTPPVERHVLYVYEEANDQVDPAFEGVLRAKGLTVDAVLAPAANAMTAMGKALIVISPGCTRADVGTKFTDVAVPVIVSKDAPPTYMKLTTSDASTANDATQIAITAPGDPLAAGLTGTVTVYAGVNRVLYGSPEPEAKRIATVVGAPNQVAIYAYDAGATMVGGFKAPAKRMGFFVHRVATVTPDGLKLFGAAVDWALSP